MSFILVILAAAAARFYHLAGHGLGECDALIYSNNSKLWFFDHHFVNYWAKPGYHFLSCLTIGLLGFHDYDLLYLNSFLDIINIILLVLIGFKLGMRRVFVLSAAVIYAFLPFILQNCADGLPHLSSTTFFLGAFYVFLIYYNSPRKPQGLLFLTGVLIAFAGNVHPTLLVGMAFFATVLIVMGLKKSATLSSLFIYGSGCLCVFIAFAFLTSGSLLGRIFLHYQQSTQGMQGNVLSKLSYSFAGLLSIITLPVVLLFLGVFCFALLRPASFKTPGSTRPINLFLLGGYVLIFLLINCFVVLGWLYRLLVPIVPLIIVGLAALADRRTADFPEEWRVAQKFLGLAIIIAIFNISCHWDVIDKRPATVFRQMADVLDHRVDDRNRLLILPSHFFAPMYYLDVYFDRNDLYRTKGPWTPEISLLQTYHIKYIALCKNLAEDKNPSDKAELALMSQWLDQRRAKCLLNSPQVSLYEVPIHDNWGNIPETADDLPFFDLQRASKNWRLRHPFISPASGPHAGHSPSSKLSHQDN